MTFVYIFLFILSLILSLVITPLVILLCRKFEVYDWPGRRKIHTRPIPRWGGLAIFLSCVICIVVAYYIFPQFQNVLSYKLENTKSKFVSSIYIQTQLIGIFIGGILILVLGMIDDKKPVQALTKLLVQIIAAYCTMDFGVRILGLNLPFGLEINFRKNEFLILLSQIITVFWLIGFMNTINLIDGLDGLATGIVSIASGTFFIIAILLKPDKIWLAKQLQMSAVLSVTLCGACLGFLFFNFNPAKIFLGDCGSLLTGFLLASISITGTLKTPLVISLFIPVIIVALPVLDVILSIFRRIRKGIGIMEPDKGHIHHRLLKLGWTHREVVLVMYVITLVLSLFAVSFTAWKVSVKI